MDVEEETQLVISKQERRAGGRENEGHPVLQAICFTWLAWPIIHPTYLLLFLLHLLPLLDTPFAPSDSLSTLFPPALLCAPGDSPPVASLGQVTAPPHSSHWVLVIASPLGRPA